MSDASDPMRPGDPTRPPKLSPAWWWCDVHAKWHGDCRRKDGSVCHGDPHKGLPKCRMHAGKSGEQLRAESEAITAWNAMGGAPSISRTQAVLAALEVTFRRWHLYMSLLRTQVEADGGQPGVGQGKGDGEAGSGFSGLIGHVYSGVKDIGIFATGERVRALVDLEAAERDRVVRFAKTASDMNVDDVVADVIRREADQVEGLLRAVLEGLGHEWGDPRVVSAVDAALVEIDGGAG